MMKKLFAMLLALVLCLGMVPGMVMTARAVDGTTWDGSTVATDYAGGKGTQSDPYIIETAGQLIYLRNKVNSGTKYNGEYFRLDADLDMADKTFGAAIGTNPNHTTSRYFNGHFDGNNHKISNLTIGDNNNGYSALFGNVGFNGQEVVIKDLTLVNVKVNRTKTNYGAAALVGQPGYARIENCIVESGTIESAAYYAGGLVASLNTSGTSGLTIINCVNKANVTNNSTDPQPFTGGILGNGNGAKITGCTNYGTITTNKYYAGGIAGSSFNATIEKCANYGAVTSTQGSASGILANGSNEVVKNCYNQGDIKAGNYATGITGLFGSTSGHVNTDTIINCYSVGTIEGTKGSHAISIKGSYPNSCKLENNYSLTAGDDYVTQKTAEEFADGTVYNLLQGANTEQVWGQTLDTDDYPVFYNGSNVPPHTHSWSYEVKEEYTITAACTASVCTARDGGSVTIAPPDNPVYSGEAIEAKVTDNLIPEYTVVYSGDGLVNGKSVNPGTYTATITLDEAKINVTYTITDVLNGITVTVDPTGDVAIPTKDNTQNITLTATANYAYKSDVVVTDKAKWTLEDTYAGVSIENNVVAITSEAVAGTITVKASYNGKEQTTVINLTKEGVGELYALGGITGPDSVSVNGATTDRIATYTITGEDKYGTIVEPIVMWSVAGMDGVTIDANGVLTVSKDAPAGEVTITATAGSLTKTKTVSITAHEHSWTYTATGDTLTATCGNDGCPSTNNELKISVPALTVYDGAESAEATLSATSIGDIATLPAIQYEQKNGESWTALSGAPDIPGSYRASITVDTNKTASVEYTIDQATLTFDGIGSASGTYGAKLSELTVSGLTAALNGTEVPGTWTLTGDVVPNVGDTESYTATFTPDANTAYYKPLTAQVTLNIALAQPAAPTAVAGRYAPNADKTAFVYTISAPVGTDYQYSTDGNTWKDNPIFDGFNAGDTATFYARVKADRNHTASDPSQPTQVAFEKLDQAAPSLSYQVSGNSGNRTITIAEVEGAEYSFDGGNTWDSSNVKTGINDETVNIAIRMKETAVYKASEKASASVNTAKQVQTVTFDTTDRTATYGDGALEAREASAEGAITYECSDTTVATVDDKGVVTIVGAGTATITAKAAETETHAAAQASYSLTVHPKALTAEGITLTLTESLYQYDGTARTPVILLKDGDTVLEADKDYQVKDGSTTTASAIAVYTITLTGKGNYTGDISEEWEITRIAAPAAPQNLQGVAPATGLVDDGKIIGTTDEMEYATKADFSDTRDCREGETTNLAPGAYYVRLKGTDTTEPGAAAVVHVPAYSVPVITFDANGGTVAIASVTTEQDGTLAELPTAARSGYTFDGWFTEHTGGAQVTADTFFSVSTTIYAQWTYIPVPPVIDSPAADTIVEVYEGQTAQMTVVSQNATSYQWFINRNDGAGFVEYDGSALATHTTAAVKPENDGFRYYCLVTNADGSVRSHVFTLRVLEQIDLPQTGDNSQIGLWAAMCLLGMAGILLLRKKPCSR